MDHDFDGVISIKDLEKALSLAGVEAKEVTSAKVERLYRLLDQYKTGSVTRKDVEL